MKIQGIGGLMEKIKGKVDAHYHTTEVISTVIKDIIGVELPLLNFEYKNRIIFIKNTSPQIRTILMMKKEIIINNLSNSEVVVLDIFFR